MGVLHDASYAGDVSKIRLALQAGEEVDSKDLRRFTALSRGGQEGVMLEAGAATTRKDGATALMCASAMGHPDAMRALLEAGAMVDSKDNHGDTALMCAGANGHECAIRLLLEAGAAVASKNNNGETALRWASVKGHAGAIRVLLEAGALIDSVDHLGGSALSHASADGHVDAVYVLLEAGATVDATDNEGITALMCASTHGHERAVRVLLEAGAAVDATAKNGVTALVGAIRCGHLNVARVLLQAGAEPPPSKTKKHPPAKYPNDVEMQQLLARHLGERRARAAEAARAERVAAEAAAEVAAAALLAEEDAEKSSAESRQAAAKRKKQRQKSKRTEAVPGPTAAATGAGPAEGQRATAVRKCGVPADVGRRASQASDGAGERVGAAGRDLAMAATLDHPAVMSVLAEEVLCALEAAGSDSGVGEGGFGKVFAVELQSLAARWGRVAVKRASGLQAADILLEVATLRLCRHRNVLPLLGYCDDARAPCMITPLMHGGSLDDRLLLSDSAFERLRRLGFEGDPCLDWQRRLSALCDAARGLAHLHRERILHRDVKTANILLEGALRSLQRAHGPPLLVHRAVLSDVGLAKVREPTLGGATTHATTRRLAISTGFVDQALVNSNQHSESTDAFGIGICILMSLVSEPAAGLMYDHEDDVCRAMEDGTGPLFGTARTAAGWPSDATRALAAMVHRLSIATRRRRQPLAEALVQMEAMLGAVGEAADDEEAMAQPAPTVVDAASAVSHPLVSSRGASMPPFREDERDARAAALAQPEAWSGGELTRMVRQLEVGDADAPLARKRERVTKAYDSMMVRLERAYAGQGHAPLPPDEQEMRKIDLLAPRSLGKLHWLAHTLRKWWNAAKHERDQWAHPPSDKEVQRLVRELIGELDGLGW